MASNTGRNIARIGGRVLGTVGGALLGQPQLGYQVGAMAGDLAGGDPATRMKQYANYTTNPSMGYSQKQFDNESLYEEQVEIGDPLGDVMPLIDTAVNATSLFGNPSTPKTMGDIKGTYIDKMDPIKQQQFPVNIQGRTDLKKANFYTDNFM